MLLHILYLIGITAEAMTGALAAGRRRMDTFGVIIIATATALGGGSVRDMLLGHYPLGWVKHPEYIIIVVTSCGADNDCCSSHAASAPPVSGTGCRRPYRLFHHRRSDCVRYGRGPGYRYYRGGNHRRSLAGYCAICSANAFRLCFKKSYRVQASPLLLRCCTSPCSIMSATMMWW